MGVNATTYVGEEGSDCVLMTLTVEVTGRLRLMISLDIKRVSFAVIVIGSFPLSEGGPCTRRSTSLMRTIGHASSIPLLPLGFTATACVYRALPARPKRAHMRRLCQDVVRTLLASPSQSNESLTANYARNSFASETPQDPITCPYVLDGQAVKGRPLDSPQVGMLNQSPLESWTRLW